MKGRRGILGGAALEKQVSDFIAWCRADIRKDMSMKTDESKPMNDIESLAAAYADLRRRYAAAEDAGEPVIELWNQMQAALAALQEAKKNALSCG